jgi:hypothetical protein
MLQPGVRRGEDAHNLVRIPARATALALELELEADNHPAYRVKLLDAHEQERWRAGGLRSSRARNGGRAILLHPPKALFGDGEYTLLLSADETDANAVAEFSFVVRQD